jgi:hypothetical protein
MNNPTHWTDEQVEIAARMWPKITAEMPRRDAYVVIGKEIGRTGSAVEKRFRRYGKDFRGFNVLDKRRGRRKYTKRLTGFSFVSGVIPPDELIRDAERRMNLEPRDTTALICGDPKPGYSALDRARTVVSFPAVTLAHGAVTQSQMER